MSCCLPGVALESISQLHISSFVNLGFICPKKVSLNIDFDNDMIFNSMFPNHGINSIITLTVLCGLSGLFGVAELVSAFSVFNNASDC